MRFSPLRFSATVANSFPRSSSKQQTLPLLKKCQTHKTPFARWRIPTGVGITKKGENNLSYQLLKFPSVRHLPLTLPVIYPSELRQEKTKKGVAEATPFFNELCESDHLQKFPLADNYS